MKGERVKKVDEEEVRSDGEVEGGGGEEVD